MSTTTVTKPLTLRERARLRKQRQRDRDRENKRLAALEEARRQELLAESLAPRVLRKPIVTSDGYMLVGPRVEIVAGRAVRACAVGVEGDPIGKLERESRRSGRITKRHKEAARMLQQDWNDVGAGIGVSAVDYARSGGGGDGTGGHSAILAQVVARTRLDGAMTHLGAFAPSIARVVLDCIPVSVWALEVGKTTEDGVTWIALALDRLAGWYWPARQEGGLRILTFGPKREVYSVEADYGEVEAIDG